MDIYIFPDNKSTSVKPINLRDEDRVRKSCTACKFKGHLVSECWGKCKFCGKYGHKSHLCRHKPPQEDSEPAKKASDGGKVKPKGKKKKGKKECLVLIGNSADREILVSCNTLMKWDLIHDTFGRETVTDYIYINNSTRPAGKNSFGVYKT